MNYRARWIDAAGVVGRDETFEWDPAEHESYGLMREDVRALALTLDAPYFTLEALQAHVGGYVEGAWRPWGYFIVNEEGMLLDWQPNPSPDVNPPELMAEGGAYIPLFGPVVLVEVVP